MDYITGRADQPLQLRAAAGAGEAADAVRPAARPAPPAGGAPGAGRGGFVNPLLVQGLPIVKPPYAVISAIDMDKGEIKWQVPYGETPDNVRNHPALKGLNIGNTGQPGSVGIVITKTLVITGDSQVTSVTHPRGAMLRAYDKATGKEVGQVLMPAPQSGSPMTYMVDGKQYIVVAVSGGAYSGEYIAYKLPDTN
jgi:quinoprotein glucose dehydrogenase